MDKTLQANVLSWASTQMSGPILEGFASISYLFYSPTATEGSGAYFRASILGSHRARRQSRSALYSAFTDPDAARGSGARRTRFRRAGHSRRVSADPVSR